MKAVIPVAGIGTRLRPHTHTQPKSLIPVAGKPILAHIVDQLIEAGVNEFIFITTDCSFVVIFNLIVQYIV